MRELWKPIDNIPNAEVSDQGRVRLTRGERVTYPAFKFWGNGYARVQMNDGTQSRPYYVHQLVARAFIANPLAKRSVNHRDGNKLNNTVDNLEWLSPSENTRHGWATGLITSEKRLGELHPRASITAETVAWIRFWYHSAGLAVKEIAAMFAVTISVIYGVIRGKTWVHVPNPYVPEVSK